MTAILELLGFNHRGLKHSRALSRVGFEALAYVDGAMAAFLVPQFDIRP